MNILTFDIEEWFHITVPAKITSSQTQQKIYAMQNSRFSGALSLILYTVTF